MRRVIFGMAAIVAASVAANIALANQPGQMRQGDPRMLFDRLDANSDGQVSMDEVPDGAPEHLKAMVKRADKNGDKKVSLQEMMQAVSQFAPGHPGARPRGSGPPAEGAGSVNRAGARSKASPPPASHGSQGPSRSTARSSGPPASRRPQPPATRGGQGSSSTASRTDSRRPAPRQRPPQTRPDRDSQQGHDPAAFFARLDRDKDGKLSLDEFTQGMRRVHAALGEGHGGPGRGPVGHPGTMTRSMRQAGPSSLPVGRPGMRYMAMRHQMMRGPGQAYPPMGHPRLGHPPIGRPGMGHPPMGPTAAVHQFAGKPGADARKIAEAHISAARDRQAAAVKMRGGDPAKRAEAIKKKAADAGKTTDREKAARAKRAAAEKTRAHEAQKSRERR